MVCCSMRLQIFISNKKQTVYHPVRKRPQLETIHFVFYTENGGCLCSLKCVPNDGMNVARNILISIFMTKQLRIFQLSVNLFGCFI
jgi:hypothetical protein